MQKGTFAAFQSHHTGTVAAHYEKRHKLSIFSDRVETMSQKLFNIQVIVPKSVTRSWLMGVSKNHPHPTMGDILEFLERSHRGSNLAWNFKDMEKGFSSR